MHSTTKKVFIIALLVAVVAVTVLIYFFAKIRAEGIKLEEQISILTENNTKETAYVKLRRLAQETEVERTTLAASFFKDESESITFLGEIETLANSLNLSLETETLDKVVDEASKQEFIKMTFGYSGQKQLVFDFSKLMELVPYHSKVESLSLRKITEDNWEGKLTILITINTI